MITMTIITADDILHFWFEEAGEEQWFVKSETFDALIRNRFSEIHQQASKGECWQWRTSPRGRLAEIIILDQFSRNIFRDKAEAFAYDAIALILAQEAVANNTNTLTAKEKWMLYMPYMHSESLIIHDEAVKLFTEAQLDKALSFEHQHRDIIKQFGRYPHRNAILGRHSTREETSFLSQPNSSF